MRANFIKASAAAILVSGAIASYSPSRAQENISLNQCYNFNSFEQIMEESGQIRIVIGGQVIIENGHTSTIPVAFYLNPADKTGYVVKHDDCAPDEPGASENLPTGVKPIMQLNDAILVDKTAPKINARIKDLEDFNDVAALEDCKGVVASECGSFNQKIDIATSNNIGIILHSKSTILKEGAYIPGPIITISADVNSNKKGAMLISRPSGATLLRMLFTSLDYTNAGREMLRAFK